MRILISNDDGIQSPGIEALVKALHREHEVIVAAPGGQQSAKSQALTVKDRVYVEEYLPLKEKYGVEALAVHGTPADSVKLYIEGVLGKKQELLPDLVISGINDGPNLGTDILYSGTIGAASEGVVQKAKALAVSLDYQAEYSFDFVAEQLAVKLPKLMELTQKFSLLNINFPKRLAADYKWIWTRQGIRDYANAYVAQKDEDGRTFYVVGGHPIDDGNPPETDTMVHGTGNVSVTPLQLDRTILAGLELGAEL